jgi:SSS family solute:Na+ symporter
MHPVDYALIIVYLTVLLYLGLTRRLRGNSSTSELIVGGRVLTLPAFVASLVSTWYGGILGVGEYSYRFGLSNWLVFGVPYYLAAFLFAVFLAKKARESGALTIPDRLAQTYDTKTALAGSIVIFFMTVPAAYILMIGVLCQYLLGWPLWLGISVGTFFSIIYVYFGGFTSVVRTDLFQFILMYLGFAVLLTVVCGEYGGLSFLREAVPSSHFSWHGGRSGWYIATWYFIALATLIEPAFYQRCYAVRNASAARRGILISIVCWATFDFMTTASGLYARALLPNLADPVGSYPALALQVLPAGLLGLFAVALLATVMSTIDSYAHLAASTFGNDIVGRMTRLNDQGIIRFTRLGLVISSGLAIILAVFFRSVVDIWYAFGSIGTPALLVPVFSSFVGSRRLPTRYAFLSVILCGGISLVWFISQYITSTGSFWLGIQPIFPGLGCSLILFFFFSKRGDAPLPTAPK